MYLGLYLQIVKNIKKDYKDNNNNNSKMVAVATLITGALNLFFLD